MNLYVQVIITLMVIVVVGNYAYYRGYSRALIDVKKSRFAKKQKEIDEKMECLRRRFNSIN